MPTTERCIRPRGAATADAYHPTMIKAYLLANALLYVLFAAWCTFAPEKTSAALGLQAINGSGRSEILTVYGGLQAGLALLFAVFACFESLQTAGLLAAACLYVPLAIWRVATLAFGSDVQSTTYVVAALEVLLALAAIALLWGRKLPLS